MIKLKGKEYKFKLGFKALLLFEEEAGQSVFELSKTLGDNFKMSTIVELCYCAIKSQEKNITKEIVIDAIDEDPKLIAVITKMVTEDMAAFGGLEEEAKK